MESTAPPPSAAAPAAAAGTNGSNGASSADTHAAVQNLRRFLDVARGRRNPLVHLQHDPDPDALGSAAAVQYMLERFLGVKAVLAYTGRVFRVENRAMLRDLNIKIKPSYKIDYDEYDLIVVVDTHPGSATCQLPKGVVPHIVIDHHPGLRDLAGVEFPYYEPSFGSTSTMVGALLVENGIPLDTRIATALTYGIKTDTMELSRGATPLDERVFRDVYAEADKRVLSHIERARVPQEYFIVLERSLRRAQVTDFAITTFLGEIGHRDSVAEVADLLFRMEGIKWVLAAGYTGPVLFCSLRAVEGPEIRAGAVAATISDGRGGGHDMYAAAQIPLPEEGANPEAMYEDLRNRFLDEIRAKKSLTRPLTLPPDAQTSEMPPPRDTPPPAEAP